jgi:hypothetical protein
MAGLPRVARASGAARSRVQQGVNELEAGTAPLEGIRKSGAGRKTLTEKDPGLVEPTRRGDPESTLSWITLSTAKLATELTGQGHRVGAESVAKLLRDNGFSLHVSRVAPLRFGPKVLNCDFIAAITRLWARDQWRRDPCAPNQGKIPDAGDPYEDTQEISTCGSGARSLPRTLCPSCRAGCLRLSPAGVNIYE